MENDVQLNVTQDNWPLTPLDRPDNSERDAEASKVITQWQDGAITYLEMVRALESLINPGDVAAICVRCLGDMGQFKSECCGELVCSECDSVCPKCGKAVFA